MENARLLKEYFLPYASCIYCSKKYTDLNTGSMDEEKCSEHHHVFNSFFVEQHQIPIIMQQFLVDLDTKSIPKIDPKYSDVPDDRLIDIKEVQQFWNEYLTTVPTDLELIWDTIDNGLNRYLQVFK